MWKSGNLIQTLISPCYPRYIAKKQIVSERGYHAATRESLVKLHLVWMLVHCYTRHT